MISPSEAPRILVVEDELELLDATVTYLKMEGFNAEGVASLAAASAWMNTQPPDLIVLDLGLPDGDGIAWMQSHPQCRQKGIVITSARSDERQRIEGIKHGADVYLVKPVALEELALLLGKLWQRISLSSAPTWMLQPTAWLLHSPAGQSVKLTHSELTVMQALAEEPGRAVPRRLLVQALGQDPETYDYRRMEVLVRRLRTKVREQLGLDLPLETAHRLGYAFTSDLRLR